MVRWLNRNEFASAQKRTFA